MPTIALPDLLGRGVRLETHEAVALAQELLSHPCGNPTLENIQLGSDGSASCISAEGKPSVSSVAQLLLTLLPAGTTNVPAALRYSIARGLGAVEAPPFASLGDFARSLERFEKGTRRDVLRGVWQRAARPSTATTAPIAVPPAPVSPAATSASPVRRGGSPVRSPGRWALAAAAGLVAAFTVGFVVADGITERRRATQPSSSVTVSPAVSAAVPAATHSAANTVKVERRDEIVHAPLTPSVNRASTPPAADAAAPVSQQVRAVRPPDENAFSPAFASEGTAIFFHTGGQRDERSAIGVAAVGGETGGDLRIMKIVDDGSRNYHAQPSPDGRLVAFDSDRDGERGIYVASQDGSQVRRISGPGHAAVPTWSRNGEWLAYIRPEADKPSVWNLWVQPVAGGNARRVTNYRYGQTWAASWFPDGRRIAYSHEDTLVVRDLQTGGTRRYKSPVKGQLVRTPAVSPDGTRIIFQVFRHGAWLLDLADGSMQRVLTDPTAQEFAWSPDGRRVAFHSRRDGRWGIYMLLGG